MVEGHCRAKQQELIQSRLDKSTPPSLEHATRTVILLNSALHASIPRSSSSNLRCSVTFLHLDALAIPLAPTLDSIRGFVMFEVAL